MIFISFGGPWVTTAPRTEDNEPDSIQWRVCRVAIVTSCHRTVMIQSSLPLRAHGSDIMVKSRIQPIDQLMADHFDHKTVSRGVNYFRTGRVLKLTVHKAGTIIKALVQGSNHQHYTTVVLINESPNGRFSVDGTCTCPVGYNCKHAVAALLVANSRMPKRTLVNNHTPKRTQVSTLEKVKNDYLQWMEAGKHVINTRPSPPTIRDPHHVCFMLSSVAQDQPLLSVTLKLARVLKTGGYGKKKNFNPASLAHERYLTDEDRDILLGLKILSNTVYLSSHRPTKLTGRNSSDCLTRMLKTGRCFLKHSSKMTPVKYGHLTPIQCQWVLLQDGYQKPIAKMGDQQVPLFLLEDAWYFDANTSSMGKVQTHLTPSQVRHFLSAPLLPPKMIKTVSHQLSTLYPGEQGMLPIALAPAIEKKDLVPTPIIQLDLLEQTMKSPHRTAVNRTLLTTVPIATIYFEYDGHLVPFCLKNAEAEITYVENQQVINIYRNFAIEKQALLELAKVIQLDILHTPQPSHQPTRLRIKSIVDDDYVSFIANTIPALELKGWTVVRQHPVYSSLVLDEEVEWYSELAEESAYDYFQFSLGIEIDGEKINILPIIADALQTVRAEEVNALDDKKSIVLPLPNGKALMVCYSRIKPILNMLIELFDRDMPRELAHLKVSTCKAMLLAEMENAFAAVKMRWFGGDRLRALGRQLTDFESIESVVVPSAFKATLRPYQQQGVNWLQFLRTYQLNGMLADDMGLGKTVQTLAHLCIEKNRSYVGRPSLIVAPTSLMVNWKNEAMQFAPHLNVLIFHGDDRKSHADSIQQYDVVLTTYPLLTRDKEILLAYHYHYVILDEAQYIKNAKAKSTQIVNQLTATHRLCLTGTPMENHLGELWSLFNFLMPGLLGDVKQFNYLFRTPIEKHGDGDRRHHLNQRVKPFLLRRQKRDVIKELPDKTNIIRTVALQGPERELYESIRLAMEKKVRNAIKKQGLSRSHIVILDALLKLRQVCCHPRLLKLKAARRAHKQGSKLALLKKMLPDMVAEGRKILIFSQFTTMLTIIEEMLVAHRLNYVKLTGQTKNRATVINRFQQTEVPIFLISLKAGGTGLNLTAADTVIHYDPWWNPAVEDQATDRAHRIGQKKSVFVYKLLTEGTVEQTILDMQQKKRALIEDLFSPHSCGKLNLTKADLQHLFQPLDGRY